MPTYIYRVRDKFGIAVNGSMEAESQARVVDRLSELGYFVISVKERKDISPLQWLGDRFRKVKADDLIIFSRQLATMFSAGLPFLTSLTILAQQTENEKLRRVIEEVRGDVEGGSTFAGALEKHPKVFSNLYVNMIRAGELGGVLEEILNRLARLAEREAEMKSKIKSSLVYPITLLAVAVLVIAILMIVVFPRFLALFTNAGVPLPLPTLILYRVSTLIRRYLLFILGVVGLLSLIFRWYINTEEGRFKFDQFKLKIPFLGSLLNKIMISRFARTLGNLIGSGVPILQCLEIVGRTIGNVLIVQAVERVHDSVEEGKSISEPLRVSRAFPPMVVQMVSVGEETGRLDEMLGKIADYYDLDVEYTIRNLVTLLEPALLVIMGCVVGFIALSVFLPLVNLLRVFRH